MKKEKRIKKIIFFVLFILIVLGFLVCFAVLKIRDYRINNMIMQNIDSENITVFCSGNNITLNNKTYSKLKEKGNNIIFVNDNGSFKLQNDAIDKKIKNNIQLKYTENTITVDINNKLTDVSLNVKDKINNNGYLSEFSNDDFLANDLKIDENGYVKLTTNGSSKYYLRYIVPESLNISDIEIPNNTTFKIELGIDEKDYTYGSVVLDCDNNENIEIDGLNIKAKEAGEYVLNVTSAKFSKSIKVNVIEYVNAIETDISDINLKVGDSIKINAIALPDNANNKELEFKSGDESIVSVDNEGNVKALNQGESKIIITAKDDGKFSVEIPVKISIVREEKTNGITYVNGIMLVNKTHSIPSTYDPGLNDEAYRAFLKLQQGAKEAGYSINIISGYRSYETQTRLYNNYVKVYGQAEADTFSARPGTSEHQTGLAMDVGWIDEAYGDTPSGKWLAANCYKYGFIIRYPKGKESITGYVYEPWHIRYLGEENAKKVYESGLTLEEYLGVN